MLGLVGRLETIETAKSPKDTVLISSWYGGASMCIIHLTLAVR